MTNIVLVRQSKPHFEVNYTHPLGLMYLASYIRQMGEYKVSILDNRIEAWPMDELVRQTLKLKPDIIGMTGMTLEAAVISEYSKRIRERAPDLLQIIGGVHATSFREEVFQSMPADLIVLGEGETAFGKIVKAHLADRDYSDIKGICFQENGSITNTGAPELIEDLDALPHPAWDLIPVKNYFGKRMGDLMFSRPQQMSVATSRSCPYRCIYCHNVFGKGFRPLSAEKSFEELCILYNDYGIREIHIQDDCFNLNKSRAKDICTRIIESNMDFVIAFPNGLRADLMDDELIDLMYRAGARRISYAAESASPRIQKLIRKNMNLEKLIDTVKKSIARGFFVKGFFMLGFPSETQEEMEATIDFACKLPFDIVTFSRVIPFKSTELYEMAKAMGKPVEFDYNQYAFDYSNVNLSAVDDSNFERIFRKAFIRFMFKPRRILRLMWIFPNKKQLFPYYFLLFFIKLLFPKRAGRHHHDKGKRHWWTIRY